jgi:hypothetical protein
MGPAAAAGRVNRRTARTRPQVGSDAKSVFIQVFLSFGMRCRVMLAERERDVRELESLETAKRWTLANARPEKNITFVCQSEM